MAKHKIEVQGVADFSSISKEVRDLNSTIEHAFGKDGAKILDDKSLTFLKKEAQGTFDKMTKQLSKLKEEAEKLNSQLKNTTGEKEKEVLTKKVLDNLKKTVSVEKDISNLKRSQNIIETGATPELQAKRKSETEKAAAKELKAQAKATAAAEKEKAREAARVHREKVQEAKKLSGEERKAALERLKEDKKRAKEKAADLKRIQLEERRSAKTSAKQELEDRKVLDLSTKLADKKRKDDEKAAAKEFAEEEKKHRSLRSMTSNKIKSGIGDVAAELPGIAGPATHVGGAAMQAGSAAAEAGLGLGAIAGLGLLAAAAAGAAVVVSRMTAGFEAFKQVLPNIVTLAGMGVTPEHGVGNRAIEQGRRLGYAEPEVLQLQEHLNRAFGRTSVQRDENRTINTLTAARGLGLQAEQIAGNSNSLRAVGGTETASKQMAMILSRAVTSGMDKTQASAFLSSAVGLLTELNADGTANTNRLLGVMSGLTARGNMSPEQAAKQIGGINAAIGGSTGESNAFFQSAAVKANLGGGSILGTQFAVRQGLTGVDMGALNKQVGDTNEGRRGMEAIHTMGLDKGGFTKEFSKGILNQVNTRFGKGEQNEQAKLGFVNSMFGGKTAGDAVRVLSILERIANDKSNKGDSKALEEMAKDPAEAWRGDVLSELKSVDSKSGIIATALQTMASQAGAKNAQIELGAEVAPVFNKLTDTLTHLDLTLANFGKDIHEKGVLDTIKDMELSLHNAALQLVQDVAEAVKNSFWQLLGISDESAKGGVNQSAKDVKLQDSDKDVIRKHFGLPDSYQFDSDKKAAAGAGPDVSGKKLYTPLAPAVTVQPTPPAQPATTVKVDNSEVVNALNVTNAHLSKISRQAAPGAPTVKRDR